MDDKSLPIAFEYCPPRPARSHAAFRIAASCLTLVALCSWGIHGSFPVSLLHGSDPTDVVKSKCQQAPALHPSGDDNVHEAFDYLFSDAFQNASIKRLSGAVQVPTESFDDLGEIGKDKRWDVFYDFHSYLNKTFPKIHKELQVETVNTHGLLVTWQGIDESKKPLVIMAHQDTVPVDRDTIDSWEYPPWSGHFDGTYIWGRGASDCKNQLIGTMEALEILLDAGFEPKRTILLSYGFDEECSGTQGAGSLAAFLLQRYGRDGIAAIVDEGMGYTEAFGKGFAVPGVAEKGYVDVDITVRIPGGHSSIPPDHTGIGILSEIITSVEAKQYPTYLEDRNPYLEFLKCGAEHAPDFPKKLKKLLSHRSASRSQLCKHNDQLALEAARIGGRVSQYLMQTSQAVDIIQGGTKVNALPESSLATINHRINIGDEPETVYKNLVEVVKPIAKKYNLTLHAFDGTTAAYSAISLSTKKHELRVAPVTPTGVDKVTAWSIVSGSIKALYGKDTIVAPALMTGNTDTRFYWELSKNIFRFGPGYIEDVDHELGNVHTVNEKASASSHLKIVRWFTIFIRNMDDAELDED